MNDLLITNGRIVTWVDDNEIMDNGAVLVQNGRIAAIGSSPDLVAKHPNVKQLDAKGQLVMPGNICAHTHFYGAFARGMGIPGPPPKDFPDILERLWWRLDRSLFRYWMLQYSALSESWSMRLNMVRRLWLTIMLAPTAIYGSLDHHCRCG